MVTGSTDRFMRLWPLDFSDFLLEAQNESPVTSVCMSTDGLKLLIGTLSGSIGILDVVSHAYTTAMRSHTSRVASLAYDVGGSSSHGKPREEFATAGEDGTIRVWDLVTGCQRYEFMSPTDLPNCLAYHPGPDRHLLACGFLSGCLRIFDIATTTTLQEYQQHRGAIGQVFHKHALFGNG